MGDFSQSLSHNRTTAGTPVQIRNPLTGLPFESNRLPASMIDPAAAGLLAFIPQPNLPGAVQNFHYVTTNKNTSNDINARVNHILGPIPQFGQRGGRGGGGQRGGGPLGRGGGGRGGLGVVSAGIQTRTQNST
jgi:hypothetical protein